jgi:DNA-directed RNA polymerase subunit RPC12/RpoP
MENKIFNCPHCGKIIPHWALNPESKRETVACPNCGSTKNYKDGKRKTANHIIQRYICCNCGHRF